MNHYLMVPARLDALIVPEQTRVVEALANFTGLPYFDGTGDANADTAYISENFVTQPFENLNLILQKGVHLHWSLPDALTRGQHIAADQPLDFPAVPNRWLITRISQGVTRRWVLESDYLYPADANGMAEGLEAGAISYPIHSDPTRTDPPFRFMGRAWPFEAWQKREAGDDYLPELTAVGYGEPTFAALYPNCRSVFGFHDPDLPPAHATIYTVVGWYSDPQKDPCAAKLSPDELESRFGWKISGDAPQTPDRLLCWDLEPLILAPITGQERLSDAVEVTVGNTATEALSAYLAHRFGQGDDETRRKLEDQLEALNLAPVLQHRQVDVGPKFEEARHEKGFEALYGGAIWQVRPVPSGNNRAGHRQVQGEITLPIDLAHRLNELNLVQQEHDAAFFVLQSWRKRLFSDWYRYMLASFPPPGEQGDYPDPDQVRHFIEGHDLPQFKAQEAKVERLQRHVKSLIADMINRLPEMQLATEADISSWTDIAQQLSDRNEPVLAPLKGTLARLGSNGSAPLQQQALDALNSLLAHPGLYQALTFPAALPAEAQDLLDKTKDAGHWDRDQTLRYNRLLLQAILPALARRARYELHQAPAPRFWQPREPVALLVGPGVEPTDRYGGGATVNCGLLILSAAPFNSLVEIDEWLVDNAFDHPAETQENEAKNTAAGPGNSPAWHPLILEWQVELFPQGNPGSERHPANGDYDPNYLNKNYWLGEKAVDLAIRYGDNLVAGRCIYSGRSLLTSHAVPVMRSQIDNYLAQQLLPNYYEDRQIPEESRDPDFFAQHRDEILDWYRQGELEDPFLDSLLPIIEYLDQDFHSLSQALSGFNAALLGHKQTMQMPVASPLSFPEDQDFVEEVSRAVGRQNRVAPQPQNDFTPLRSGTLHLTRLRLINNFGQVWEIDPPQVLAADVMYRPDEPRRVTLPPRMVQPARLDWRWLAGQGDDMEMNSHPATSPICGWLVPNNLDGSVLVYNEAGRPLGTLNQRDAWWPAPAVDTAVEHPQDIPNLHLRRVVGWLYDHAQTDDGQGLVDFIFALDSAQENIDPDGFAQHEGLALLMGRPLAVVRATIGLQLRGLPADDQDWNIFRQELASGERDTAAIEQLRVPVRLGERRQLNDGLAGYWLEQNQGTLSSHFYSPQSDPFDSEVIITYEDDLGAQDPRLPHLQLSLAGAPQSLTLLVDPRGAVHATCGLLPTVMLSIPADQYATALASIEVTFFSTPLLQTERPGKPDLKIALPLPVEAGYAWSWLEREDDGSWLEVTDIGPAQRQAKFDGRTTIREGWLRLRPQPADSGERSSSAGKTPKNGQ